MAGSTLPEHCSIFLENLLDAAREPLVILDKDFRVLLVSRAFYELFHLKPRETIGHLIFDLGIRQWDVSRLRILLTEILPTKGSVTDFEAGPTLLLNARRVDGPAMLFPVVLLALDDVTPRQVLIRSLAASRSDLEALRVTRDDVLAFNQNIIDTVREPLLVLDSDLMVVAASKAFYLSFRTPPDQTLGRSVFSLGNGQWDIPRLRELLDAILLQGSTFHDYEVIHDFTDLGQRTMLLNARLVRQSPEKSHIILLAIEDVTERRLLEAEVQKNQRVESLGILAGGIAHDFNNLMGGLSANVELVKAHLIRGDVVAALARLEKVPAIFVRGRALTRRLLTFSKGGAPTRTLTALGPLCGEWMEFALVGADLAVTLEVDPELWLCDCDAGQIGQVVSNLLINARQASPPGGPLSLEASNVLKPGPYVRFRIANAGPPIPAEIIGRIFDPFFTTKEQGSGLGLAIAFSIVRQHGGWIDVTSTAIEGTVAMVFLPASLRAPATVPSHAADHGYHGSGVALVMDDDQDILDAVGEMMKNLGYEVFRAETGQEIVEVYRQLTRAGRPVAVALLDSQVAGGMGGPAAAQHLRELGFVGPVIIASGHFDAVSLPVVSESDGFWRLAKPFSWQELTLVLSSALEIDISQ